MEFRFDVNPLFRAKVIRVDQNLAPQGFTGDRRQLLDATNKMTEIINSLGEASARAQGLTKPVTSAQKLRNSDQNVYLLAEEAGKNGCVVGMLKVGKKNLYIFDPNGETKQVLAPCVLDFYVHESRQRSGLGKLLFEAMLDDQHYKPAKMAIDRPSEKLIGFFEKHYDLKRTIPQMNNFVVYDGFFEPNIQPTAQEIARAEERQVNITNSPNTSLFGPHTVTGQRQLQQHQPQQNGRSSVLAQMPGFQTSPMGRFGAPRPHCSMSESESEPNVDFRKSNPHAQSHQVQQHQPNLNPAQASVNINTQDTSTAVANVSGPTNQASNAANSATIFQPSPQYTAQYPHQFYGQMSCPYGFAHSAMYSPSSMPAAIFAQYQQQQMQQHLHQQQQQQLKQQQQPHQEQLQFQPNSIQNPLQPEVCVDLTSNADVNTDTNTNGESETIDNELNGSERAGNSGGTLQPTTLTTDHCNLPFAQQHRNNQNSQGEPSVQFGSMQYPHQYQQTPQPCWPIAGQPPPIGFCHGHPMPICSTCNGSMIPSTWQCPCTAPNAVSTASVEDNPGGQEQTQLAINPHQPLQNIATDIGAPAQQITPSSQENIAEIPSLQHTVHCPQLPYHHFAPPPPHVSTNISAPAQQIGHSPPYTGFHFLPGPNGAYYAPQSMPYFSDYGAYPQMQLHRQQVIPEPAPEPVEQSTEPSGEFANAVETTEMTDVQSQKPIHANTPLRSRNGLAQTYSSVCPMRQATTGLNQSASSMAIGGHSAQVPVGTATSDLDVIVRNSLERLHRMTDAQQQFYRSFSDELKNGFYDRKSNGLDPGYMRMQRRPRTSGTSLAGPADAPITSVDSGDGLGSEAGPMMVVKEKCGQAPTPVVVGDSPAQMVQNMGGDGISNDNPQ